MKKKWLIFRDIIFEKSLEIKNIDNYIKCLQSEEWEFCDTGNLEVKLAGDFDVFINFYGPYFPKKSFSAFEQFLKGGNGFISFNGMAFEIPCVFNPQKGVWWQEGKRLSYIRRLNIQSVLKASAAEAVSVELSDRFHMMDGFHYFDSYSDAQNLIMIPTKDKYVEHEWGSAGSMDSKMNCLAKGKDRQGEHVVSPAVLIEHRAGRFAGGSWIITTQKLSGRSDSDFETILNQMCTFLAYGYTEIDVKPSFPIYREGEVPTVRVHLQHMKHINQEQQVTLTLNVFNLKNKLIFNKKEEAFIGDRIWQTDFVIAHITADDYYRVEAVLENDNGIYRKVSQGFLIGPVTAAEVYPRFSPGKDYFIQEGQQKAIIGMTYMSGESGRAFLHIPNVDLWLREMQDMKRKGVNWIRTGIWTNWRTYMLDDGHMDELILRSIEAFISSAAVCGLHVTFTFFSFVPETWEGSHPYLDPRSINAQKRFISNITARCRRCQNVDWDLINEPYTFDHPTQKKRGTDIYERQAYIEYIKDTYGSIEKFEQDMDCISGCFEELQLPQIEDINFAVDDMSRDKNGLLWRDYNIYMHRMFRDWAKELAEHIHKQTGHMVTVGQDEGLRHCRPVPATYGDVLDYDAQHTWWLLSDLGWDTIFSKSHNRPLMVQETGVMYTENADGFPRRDENAVQKLLRKKYAYAFGTKSAGVIQWIWNSNYFLNSSNESNIGALRCDGSYKPEVDVTKDFAAFFEKAQPYLSDIRRNEIAVVFPFSNDWGNKRQAQKATAGITKILTNYLHVDFDGVSEFKIKELAGQGYQIIIVPSPHNLSVQAHKQLKELAILEEITIIFTGPACLDENYRMTDFALLPESGWSSLNQWESLKLENKAYSFQFEQDVFLTAQKAGDGRNQVLTYPVQNSIIYHVGVPVELSKDASVLAEFYESLLGTIGYKPSYSVESEQNVEAVFVSCVRWKQNKLYTAINESDELKTIRILDQETETEIQFDIPGNEIELFVMTETGEAAVVIDKKEQTLKWRRRNEKNDVEWRMETPV